MKYFNTNTLHNVLNITAAALATLEYVDFNPFFDDPKMTAMVVSGILITKIIVNVFRDGLAGLVANQPPVEK